MGKKKLTSEEIDEMYGRDSKKTRKKIMLEETEPDEAEKKMWRIMAKKKLHKKILRERRRKK